MTAAWDPWVQKCTCGHEMRDHFLDWDRPDDDITPDCTAEGCQCMDFELAP